MRHSAITSPTVSTDHHRTTRFFVTQVLPANLSKLAPDIYEYLGNGHGDHGPDRFNNILLASLKAPDTIFLLGRLFTQAFDVGLDLMNITFQ
jgi:hypothetical protein